MKSNKKVLLLKNNDVMHRESDAQSELKCQLMGILWKLTPNSFKNKKYVVVDAN